MRVHFYLGNFLQKYVFISTAKFYKNFYVARFSSVGYTYEINNAKTE